MDRAPRVLVVGSAAADQVPGQIAPSPRARQVCHLVSAGTLENVVHRGRQQISYRNACVVRILLDQLVFVGAHALADALMLQPTIRACSNGIGAPR
jgi:hypothetical protein